jgi:pyruvate-ferredoxin/flavodoxin oxidoreductase
MALAEADARERWRYYEQLAGVPRTAPHLPTLPVVAAGPAEEDAP